MTAAAEYIGGPEVLSSAESQPHSLEAEQGALGIILNRLPEASDLLPQVSEADFFDDRHKALYRVVDKHRPLDDNCLLETLRSRRRIEDVGGLAYVFSTLKEAAGANTDEMFEIYRSKVREYAERRQLLTLSSIAANAARNAVTLNGEVDYFVAQAAWLMRRRGADTERSKKLLAERRFDPNKRPPAGRVVFAVSGVRTSTPGNITVIVSGPKKGKTALTGAMMANAVGADESCDTLGVSGPGNPNGLAVLHFDLEQSASDWFDGIERVRRRAKLEELPNWFLSYHLNDKNPAEAWALIQQAITDAAEQFGGVFAIFIDGFGDIVPDVNESVECIERVAQLLGLALKHDCPIVGVLHHNPGTEKGRGHLGSQLERKSESNLVLERDGEIITVYAPMQRGAPIPKDLGPRFCWSDEHKMHVSCPDAKSEREAAELDALRLEVHDIFDGKGLRHTDLRRAIIKDCGCSERTAERKIKRYKAAGLVKTIASLYHEAA